MLALAGLSSVWYNGSVDFSHENIKRDRNNQYFFNMYLNKGFCTKQSRRATCKVRRVSIILKFQFKIPSIKRRIVISLNVKSFSMVKQLSITMIFVTSVLGLGAIGFDSFVVGQPNISSSQTPNQPNTFGAGGGGGGDGISVDSNNNCGTLIIIR